MKWYYINIGYCNIRFINNYPTNFTKLKRDYSKSLNKDLYKPVVYFGCFIRYSKKNYH